MAKNGTKRVYLSRADQRRLEDFINAHWAEIARLKMTQNQVAELAHKNLSLTVNKNHVAGAAQALGKEWPSPARPESSGYANVIGMPRAALQEVLLLTVAFAKEFNLPVSALLNETADNIRKAQQPKGQETK